MNPMARYIKEFPIVDYPKNSYAEIGRFLKEKKFVHKNSDGEILFQKGNGVWVAPSFIKVSYSADVVQVEAWIDVMGGEQDLEGFSGAAVKKTLKKIVSHVEYLLQRANPEYLERKTEMAQEEMPVVEAVPQPVQELPKSKKEYYEKFAGESFYRNLRINAIIGYVLCGIAALGIMTNPFALIDVLIYLGLLLGMHLGKSKGCAIAITVYAAINMGLFLVLSGTIAGS